MMKIPFNDLSREYAEIGNEISEAVQRVLRKGQFILGEEGERFEEEFSRYVGAKHGIGVNSGSDALLLAVKALGIGPGDEVITVSHTFISTVDAIVRNGATPVFVDIDPDTYCMDTTLIAEKITSRTKAILPVHLYGFPADMTPIMALAKEHHLFVIEDACQAHGANYRGKKAGTIGDVGCFSFYPAKNLGAYGDGGMAVTNDADVALKLRMLRNYGQKQKYYHDFIGVNSRLDELQAAILRVKLSHLDVWNVRRRQIGERYTTLLRNTGLKLPVEREYGHHVYHLYVVRSAVRQALEQLLGENGIQTQIHYPVPVHLQQAYSRIADCSLPVTEKICNEIVSLPLHPFMRDEEVLSIATVITNASR